MTSPLTGDDAFDRLDCLCIHHQGIHEAVKQWQCPECVKDILRGVELRVLREAVRAGDCPWCLNQGDPEKLVTPGGVVWFKHGVENCKLQNVRSKIAEMEEQ